MSNGGERSPATGAVVVRRALPGDAAAMARAHARSWPFAYGGLLPERVIADVVESEVARAERWRGTLGEVPRRRGASVAERAGRLVGFVFWGPAEDADAGSETGEVFAIYLEPEAIGQGIGRALLAAAEHGLLGAGFEAASLWVLDSNERARRFYEAAGWRPDGVTKAEERPGGTLHEVRYRKALGRVAEAP
jgi:GNAT superfamily N-acetyltransferase